MKLNYKLIKLPETVVNNCLFLNSIQFFQICIESMKPWRSLYKSFIIAGVHNRNKIEHKDILIQTELKTSPYKAIQKIIKDIGIIRHFRPW